MPDYLEFLRAPSPKWLQPFETAVKALLGNIFGVVLKLFQAEVEIADNIQHIVTNVQALVKNTQVQVERVRNFEFDPHWKSRVINVPIAIDQIRTLIEKVSNGWRERVQTLMEPVHQLSLIFKAEAAPDPLGDHPSQLSRAAVKVDELATMIAQLAKATDTLVEVQSLFDEVFFAIQNLEPLFLKQGNTRERFRLVEPKRSLSLRMGKLHKSLE